MAATLMVTHKAIGAEVRRGTYEVLVDGELVGSVDMNETIEKPVEPGKSILPISLLSFVVPGLALSLHRE